MRSGAIELQLCPKNVQIPNIASTGGKEIKGRKRNVINVTRLDVQILQGIKEWLRRRGSVEENRITSWETQESSGFQVKNDTEN